jgi:hypothetical protein
MIRYEQSDTVFKLKFVQWRASLHKELSKAYFINEKNEEMHKEYTTLNKKADEYFHSVYIQSEFFTDCDFSGSEYDAQVKLYHRSRTSPEFKFLQKKVNELLRTKRKIFLKEYSSRLLARYEKEGVIAVHGDTQKDLNHRNELLSFIKIIYEIQPKLFSNLSIDQKKTIVSLLDMILVSDQRQLMMAVLENIVEMDEEEKAELNAILMG